MERIRSGRVEIVLLCCVIFCLILTFWIVYLEAKKSSLQRQLQGCESLVKDYYDLAIDLADQSDSFYEIISQGDPNLLKLTMEEIQRRKEARKDATKKNKPK